MSKQKGVVRDTYRLFDGYGCDRGVDRDVTLCLMRQPYRRADAFMADAASFCLMGQLYRRADAFMADAASFCLMGQLYRRADAFMADAALWSRPALGTGMQI